MELSSEIKRPMFALHINAQLYLVIPIKTDAAAYMCIEDKFPNNVIDAFRYFQRDDILVPSHTIIAIL